MTPATADLERERDAIVANIRAEMARRDLLQNDLAELLGLSHAAVSRRMKGATNFDVIELLVVSRWLGIPIDELVAPAGGNVRPLPGPRSRRPGQAGGGIRGGNAGHEPSSSLPSAA